MSVELLEDAFPHGTVEGHEAGCRGRICPGREAYGWSCAEAVLRFRGDWGFRKRVLAGMGPAEIAAEETEVREAERRAAKAARRAERAARRPARVARVKRERPRKTDRRVRAWTQEELVRIGELNAAGRNDSEIAREMGRAVSSVRERRVELGLRTAAAKVGITHGTRGGYERGCRDGCPAERSCADVAREYWREANRKYRERQRELAVAS